MNFFNTVHYIVVKDNDIFAVTDYGIFLSADDGTTWTEADSGFSGSATSFYFKDDTIFAGTFNGVVYVSSDNGTSWTATNTGITGTGIRSLVLNNGNIFAGTYLHGIYISTDNGISWNAANSGITNVVVNCLAIKGHRIFAGTNIGLFLKNESTNSWKRAVSGIENPASLKVNSLLVNGDDILAGTDDGIYLSVNNGTDWRQSYSGLEGEEIRSLAVNGSTIFAGVPQTGIYVSEDNGASWTEKNTGLLSPIVTSLAVYDGVIFAGMSYGAIFLSATNGSDWFFNDSLKSERPMFGINTFCGNRNNLFIGDNHGVLRSTDYGANWSVSLENPDEPGFCVFDLSVIGGSIFAGTVKGILQSADNGNSWTDVNLNLRNQLVTSIASNDSAVFIGTYQGVWRCPLSDFSIAIKSPRDNKIVRNGFNIVSSGPFGKNTMITFSLPHRQNVQFFIYNLSGSVIQSLANRYFDTGSHTLRWDIRSLSPGYYVLRMNTETSNCIRSYTLIR